MKAMNEYHELYSKLIANFNDPNDESWKSNIEKFFESFDRSIKGDIIKKFATKTSFNEIEKKALNCLCTTINILNLFMETGGRDYIEKLFGYLNNFIPYSESGSIGRRITEMILYCVCNYCSRTIDQERKLITLKEDDISSLKQGLEECKSEKMKVSTAIICCLLVLTYDDLVTAARKYLKGISENTMKYWGIQKELVQLALEGVGMKKYNQMADNLKVYQDKVEKLKAELERMKKIENTSAACASKDSPINENTEEYFNKLSLAVPVQNEKDRNKLYKSSKNYESMSGNQSDQNETIEGVITYIDIQGFNKLCRAAVINGKRKSKTVPILEKAAESGCRILVREVLRKSIYNEQVWNKVRSIAKNNGYNEIVEDITERERLILSRNERNFSILHTAVCDNDDDMVEYILRNKLVDKDINHSIFGTALALAHSLCHRRCIKVLEKFKVNPNTQNKFGQTPLHEAISSGTHDQCQYLMEKCSNIDQEGFNGLTALHCAVVEGLTDLSEQLSRFGADCTLYTKLDLSLTEGISEKPTIMPLTTSENAMTLCLKFNKTIYPCWQNLNQKKYNLCDGSENSLLLLAAVALQQEICKILIDAKVPVNRPNEKGNTPILELFLHHFESREKKTGDIIKVAKMLVASGANINAQTKDGKSVSECAAQFNDERLMMVLLKSTTYSITITEGIFNLVFDHNLFKFGEGILKLVSKDEISSWITTSHFKSCITVASEEFITCFFDKTGPDIQQLVVEDILFCAAKGNKINLFNHFLKLKILNPKLFTNGEHLMTNLLRAKKKQYSLRIIDSENRDLYVNMSNKRKQLPIQVAVDEDEIDIANCLVSCTSDVNNEDINGETVLSQLFKKISACEQKDDEKFLEFIHQVIYSGGDIYKKTEKYKKVIDACTKQSVVSKIKAKYEFKREESQTSLSGQFPMA